MTDLYDKIRDAMETAGVGWLFEQDPRHERLSWKDVPLEVFAVAATDFLLGHLGVRMEDADPPSDPHIEEALSDERYKQKFGLY